MTPLSPSSPGVPDAGRRAWLRIAVLAAGWGAVWAALVWAIHQDSPRTMVGYHGFIHAGVAQRYLEGAESAYPPENPFYAGQPLCYYWVYSLLASGVARLADVDVFRAFSLINMAALGALMVLAVYLGRVLFRSTVCGLLMGYLVVAGANPLGPVFALLRIVFLSGSDELTDDPNFRWGVVHPLYSLNGFDFNKGLHGPFFHFFLDVSSRAASLTTLLGMAVSLGWFLRSPRPVPWLALTGTVGLTTALSPLMGLSTGGTLVGALVVSALAARWGPRPWRPGLGLPPRAALAASSAIILGVAAAFPTYYHLLLGPSDSQVRLGLQGPGGLRYLGTVATGICLLLPLAGVGLLRAPARVRPFLAVLILASLVLLAADVLIDLPFNNSTNFFHSAGTLLAVPAAGAVIRRGSADPDGQDRQTSTPLAAAIVLACLPTLLLTGYVHLNRPPIPLAFEGTSLRRLPPEGSLARFYQWVRSSTPGDAVFILDPRESNRLSCCGNAPELPAMTCRTVFTEERTHYLVSPYPDSRLRYDLAVKAVTGKELSNSEQTYLREFGRPLYIVVHQPDDPAVPDRMRERYGAPAFHADGLAVFRWPDPPVTSELNP